MKQAILVREMFLKKIKFKKLIFISFVICFIFSNQIFADEKNYKKLISEYFISIENFSASFLQNDIENIQEGKIYIKKETNRIKIDYLKPTKITIILSENKAMYLNLDLEEVEYFNPKKTLANIFFNVFYDINFFNNSEIKEGLNILEVKKNISLENKTLKTSILFEKSPLIIKQLKLEDDEQDISMTLINTNFNEVFEDNFFSLANPLLN